MGVLETKQFATLSEIAVGAGIYPSALARAVQAGRITPDIRCGRVIGFAPDRIGEIERLFAEPELPLAPIGTSRREAHTGTGGGVLKANIYA